MKELRDRLKLAQDDASSLRRLIASMSATHAFTAPIHAALQIAEQRVDSLFIAMNAVREAR